MALCTFGKLSPINLIKNILEHLTDFSTEEFIERIYDL
jgi:hypothetical protein